MKVSKDGMGRRASARIPVLATVTLLAVATALSAGCASSKGKGKIAKEIRNLPNGLIADTTNARHTDKTLENVDPAEGE